MWKNIDPCLETLADGLCTQGVVCEDEALAEGDAVEHGQESLEFDVHLELGLGVESCPDHVVVQTHQDLQISTLSVLNTKSLQYDICAK